MLIAHRCKRYAAVTPDKYVYVISLNFFFLLLWLYAGVIIALYTPACTHNKYEVHKEVVKC